MHRRRDFLGALAIAAPAALAVQQATASTAAPRLGVVASANGPGGPDRALATVHQFGLPTSQLGVGMAPASLAGPIRDAVQKYGIEITALMTQGEGKMVWNL